MDAQLQKRIDMLITNPTRFEEACSTLHKVLNGCTFNEKKDIMMLFCELADMVPSTIPIKYADKDKKHEQSYRVVFKEIVHQLLQIDSNKKQFIEALCNVNT